ncbi:GNAT family N-acetyltransferase [Streptacidiphilus rugosus]|uniref:GNAT family N-acetyltransferase n=1 Tax=Streptacidiphilus rugosus TaxID=405783 RepID=UPI0007C67A17|nr:N-acetyltransferase [Streptacidiphilus rugosus]
MTDTDDRVLIRRADPADVGRLVELRALMMTEMGEDVDADPSWRGDAAAWFARRMEQTDTFAAFVAALPAHGVVSCAVGTVDDHAPSPRNRSGRRGEIANVVTSPDFRGRGLARACMGALLDWFAEETAATTVRLAATSGGEALYRGLGFTEPRDLILQTRVTRAGQAGTVARPVPHDQANNWSAP